jgi:hypothetical protein
MDEGVGRGWQTCCLIFETTQIGKRQHRNQHNGERDNAVGIKPMETPR